MTTQDFGRIVEVSEEEENFGRILNRPKKEKRALGPGGIAISRGLLKSLGGALDSLYPLVGHGRPDMTIFKGLLESLDLVPTLDGPLGLDDELFSFEDYADSLVPRGEDAGFLEDTIERASGILPYLLGGGSSVLAKLSRAGLGGLLGQTTKELGGGEFAQAIAEIFAMGGPGFGKNIIGKKAQKEGINMLRKRGLSEKQIAPLIPSEKKRALLGKIGSKGVKTEKAARKTREGLGNIYSQLKEEGSKLPHLSRDQNFTLGRQLESKLEKVPASIRKVIKEDLQDLLKSPIKGDDIINFWEDINSSINWKSIADGRRKLNTLKNPLLKSLKEISPTLGKDFEITNKFYSQMKKVYPNLRSTDFDKYIALGELASLIGGVFKFGPKAAIPVLGVVGARKLASEMLTNPRLQNLTKQMGKALRDNKIAIAQKINQKIAKELNLQPEDRDTK